MPATTTSQRLNKAFRAILCLAIPFLAAACGTSGQQPGEFITLPDAKWDYGHVLTFNSRADTLPGRVECMAIAVRHTNNYPYANLWLELSYGTTDGTAASDTLDIRLADAYGRWLGKGSGPVMTLTDTVYPSATPAPGTPFRLRHIMRVETLEEIEQIGLIPVTVPNDSTTVQP